ncbi:hypothetical protein IP92_05753 [Pseudoduganella flava]|uniref:Uncharacterized protein n=1 Tax=Pseudoduganella flava TaxID=871742 RepID=A0A562P9N5_9BURK|nr:hypothetical protein [Pseudoduganella flava]QGZ42714.1 hypothetical protein GO485_29225 [Pseudoduganella flava]TWI41033.1 hypothetical protein IP92_05753 [Pseudoduganella flava]
MRAAQLNPETYIVENTIEVSWTGQLPWLLLVNADYGGEIGDWYHDGEFVKKTDPRHPLYVAPPASTPEGA